MKNVKGAVFYSKEYRIGQRQLAAWHRGAKRRAKAREKERAKAKENSETKEILAWAYARGKEKQEMLKGGAK